MSNPPVSPNTNIDNLDEILNTLYYETRDHDFQWDKAEKKAKTQLEALLSAAKIEGYNQALEDADKPVHLPPPQSFQESQ